MNLSSAPAALYSSETTASDELPAVCWTRLLCAAELMLFAV